MSRLAARVVSLVALAGTLGLFVGAADPQPPTPLEGILPVGADGKPLNLDFETGTLKDWTAEGDAFKDQPIKGDTVSSRRGDMKSGQQGQFWIGGYEKHGDTPQGTLTSVAFKITHPWGSFLVGGGSHPTTCVELVRKDTGEVFFRASGRDDEQMQRVAVDLKPHAGKEMFIRIVDKHSGGWGHINFDDFRFHSDKPKVPDRITTASADVYKYAGLPPEKSAQVMTVPEGFEVKLFAGEPDVCQPVALCLDDRGRVWVAEAYCYPQRRADRDANDRIVIFEDSKGTGHFDKRTVFMEGLNLVSGLEVGFGGVWIGAAPHLMFVPVKDGEDKPAGKPRILLDGWGYQDTHEVLNTFTWGPDGWLYGCHGVFTHSRVGKPGTPDAQRTPINAGVWRYHPTRHVFEVFAQGTSNPWGLDFNEFGHAFVEACVIPHSFHIIQGGRYHRQAGNHFNPFTYDDIKTIADHRHYVGGNPHGGNNRSDSAGGGHAHCGLLIYQGGAWPAEYQGQMFMGNIHGRRINADILKPKGSGYSASHGPDLLLANDAWARFINMRTGPDGNVYLIDWYDKQACHTGDIKAFDRDNGRVYKICYRGAKPVQVDLQKCTDQELIDYQLHKNEYFVQHARRILQERAGKSDTQESLAKITFGHEAQARRLHGLWALHVTGGLPEERLVKGLADPGEQIRAWSVQLAVELGKPSATLLQKFSEMAKSDPSPVVRLYIASALQRLPLDQRWDILQGLLSHREDAGDHNLPLMYWYAAEPLGASDPARALRLAASAKLPQMLPFMVRRIGSIGSGDSLKLLVSALSKAEDATVQRAYLRGLSDALKGQRQVAMPPDWPAASEKLLASNDADIRSQVQSLGVTFGDTKSFATMRKVLTSKESALPARQEALAALLSARDKELVPVLLHLVGEPALRGAAIRGLASFDDPKTPDVVLAVFGSLSAEEKRDALNTLAARVGYAKALLDAIAAKKILPTDVSADVIRQMGNLQDKGIDARIGEVWGIVRATPADRVRMMAQYRKMLLSPSTSKTIDLPAGRAMFSKTCAQCHTLFAVGGKVGPELTGANRGDLNYLLENIIDPSAVIPKEYAATIIGMKDGRIITGIVKQETAAALTVQTANEILTLAKGDIESTTPSNVSMMPDDLLKTLKDDEVRALFAYLQSPRQVPLLATAENARDLFNGKDLTGWDGDPKLWKVENGEIVGRSPGIKHNEFLRSHMVADDFRLTVKLKLVPNSGNSGIQFRSEALPNGDVKGYQADVGEGGWGKLYEENGRAVLWDKSGEPQVKPGEWNEYGVLAIGSRIRTFINGKPCVDLDDPKGARRGIFAFQIHSGAAMEVRFKDMKLEVNPAAR